MSFYSYDFNATAPGAPSPVTLEFPAHAQHYAQPRFSLSPVASEFFANPPRSPHPLSNTTPSILVNNHDLHQYYDQQATNSSLGHRRASGNGTEVNYSGQPNSPLPQSLSPWINHATLPSPSVPSFNLQPLPAHPMLAAAIPPRTLPVDVPYLDAAAKLNLSQMSLAQISALKDIKMPLMRTPSDFEFVKSHNELVNGLQNDNRVEQVGQSGAATGSATPVLPHATLSEQGSQQSVVDPEWASFYAALADDDEEEYSESWKELSYAAEYGVDVFDWPEMPSSKRALAKDPSVLSVVSEDDDDDSDAESTSTLTSGIEHHDSVPSSSFPAASSIQNILDGPVLPHPDEPPQLHEKRKLSAMLCDLANVSDGDTDVEDPSPSQSSPKKARTASQVYDPRTQTAKVFCQWTDPLDGTKCGCGFISSSELRKHLERTHVVREIQYFHHQYIPITQARALILITLLRLDRTEPNRRTKKWKELTYQVIMVKSSILSMTLDQAEWDSGKFNHFLEEMSRTVVIMATPLTCLSCGQKFETGKKARTEFNRHVAACSVTSSPKKSGLRKEKKYQDDSKKLRWA